MTGISLPLTDLATREYLLHHRVCPHGVDQHGHPRLAISPSACREAISEIRDALTTPLALEEVPDDELQRLIERLTTSAERSLETAVAADDDLATDVRDLANQPPVVRYVNLLVRDAYDAGASDIHLEASRHGLLARMRLDGVLTQTLEPPANLHHAVVSRIKLLAELDIAERRRPQDGRVRVRLESRELDLRVSTVPTMFGESVVLRLLDRGGRPVQLGELGMDSRVLAMMSELTARPHGMVLVTGPTGSGKTTTLYAALQQRHTVAEKIITVEDPIEYQLPGVTQVPVHRQAGVTFGSALRSILRQDPDVVMIGEMRDAETAEIAVQAAMTGHLLFSTLHTNDAVSAIPRLIDLGVPEFLIAATLEGVLAQRLVRTICDDCRESYTPERHHVALLTDAANDATTLTRGAGCDSCRGTGYRGRLGLFELMTMTDTLRDAVTARAPRTELRRLAIDAGMHSLRADGWQKVVAGLTTIEEVLRVTEH